MASLVLDSTTNLTAVLAAAPATRQPTLAVTYLEGSTDCGAPDAVEMNGLTAVVLLAAPAAGKQRYVTRLDFANLDTVSTTVTIFRGTTAVRRATVPAGTIVNLMSDTEMHETSVETRISSLEMVTITLSTPTAITTDGYLFGADYSFPTGYIIDRILCLNNGPTTDADDAEVALHLNTSDGDYVAVGRGRASKGWGRIAVSLPLAFYTTSGQIYVTLGTGHGTFGSELISGDTYSLGSDWSGSFAEGWTHTAAEGNTGTITGDTVFTVGTIYKIAWTIKNRTAGSITVAAAGITVSDIVEDGRYEDAATEETAVVVTPTSDFDGTVMISVSAQETPAAPSISVVMQLTKV